MHEVERQYHEVANIFPLMTGDEFEGLKADIATNGLLEPVWLHPDDHSIIDGRNRHKACVDLGKDPKFRYWDGKGSLVSFVVSLNLKRRHLTPSQAAMVGVEILPMLEAEAKAKQVTAGETHGRGKEKLVANLPQAIEREPAPKARDQAAAIVGVSARSIQDAKTVKEHGSTELIAAVKSGQVAVSTAAKIAQAPPKEQVVIVAQGPKQIVEASKQIRAERAEARREDRTARIVYISENNKPVETTVDRLYPVIYADPPWEYAHSETESRTIENHYPTMTLGQICALPIANIATPDAVLVMWTTSPKLAESLQVVSAWGFNYRTCMVWDKEIMGMGYYARQQHELLLFAARGSLPVPETDNRPRSVIRIRRDNEHSAKPTEFYEIIERMYPEYAKIELFARNQRAGWDRWGNQA